MVYKIYIASSWRNERHPHVVNVLRGLDFEVYDFRADSFQWKDIDPNWEMWTTEELVHELTHPLAQQHFKLAIDALNNADALVLVLPCGASSHLELGYAIAARKHTAILLEDSNRAELMYTMVDYITSDVVKLANWLNKGA